MDKNKIIEAAAKLVAKGAYDKAIKEYQRILDVDPKDVRILQKMGELYQKKNDNAQAAVYFTRVAESYTNDGFFLKAVALYKQVLKLDPSLLEVNVKLAELHQQLQLLGEAMAYYQIVANHFDKAGDTRKSLEVLKKMVDLDPDNIASRVKLADLYVREGLNAEAAGEFGKAAEHLKRNNRLDDYLRVAERLSSLDPDNLGLAKELAELYLQRNDQKRALAKLQVCFKADNRDIDTLRLLAVAFQGLGQTSKTISVYKELARAYEERGQGAEADQVWGQVAQLDPNDGDVAARRNPGPTSAVPQYVAQPLVITTSQQPAVQASATAVQGTYVPAQATVAARPKGDNIAKLLTETDVYVKYGLHDKALEHLRKVFAVEPENIDAHEKAYAIYVASNNHAQAFEQLLNVLRLHTRSGDSQRAQPYLTTILQQNPGHPEVPVFVAALRGGGAPGAGDDEAHERVADDAILVDSSDDEVIVADDPNDEVISAEVSLSQEALLDQAPVAEDEVLLSPHDAYEAAQVDVEPPPVAEAGGDEPIWQDAQVDEQLELAAGPALGDDEPSTGEFPVADEETGGLGMPVTSVESYGADLDAPPEATALLPSQSLAGSPFEPIPMKTVSLRSPPVNLGEDAHEMPTRVTHRLDPSLLQTYSGGIGAAPVRTLTSQAYQPEAEPELLEPLDEPVEPTPLHGSPEEEPVEAPPEEEPAAEEVDEATFFMDQGLYDEAKEILETVLIAYPEHQRAARLLAQVEALEAGGQPLGNGAVGHEQPTDGGSRDAFNLAAELADELSGEHGGPELGGGVTEDYQVSVEEVFAEFKKGLEKVVKPEDVDTHYDLGVAYKEMGLVEDAVSEFTIARKGCVGKRKEVDCLSMIGLLQTAKGDPPAAVDAFMQALTSEHATGEVEKSLRYDLGLAYEAGGQLGRALAQYLRVQRLDPGYREVDGNVARLSAVASPEDDAAPQRRGPGGGARKVGYV